MKQTSKEGSLNDYAFLNSLSARVRWAVALVSDIFVDVMCWEFEAGQMFSR